MHSQDTLSQSLFHGVKSNISQHLYKLWLGAKQVQAIAWTNDDPIHYIWGNWLHYVKKDS